MKKIFTSLIGCCFLINVNAQVIQPFKKKETTANSAPSQQLDYSIWNYDIQGFNKQKSIIPHLEDLKKIHNGTAKISLPVDEKNLQQFYIAEIQVLSDASAKLYPDIKTYELRSIDKINRGRMVVSNTGIRATLFFENKRIAIQPLDKNNPHLHKVFIDRKELYTEDIKCGIEDKIAEAEPSTFKTTAALGDGVLRAYDLAVAATGEYTTLAGGQANAVADITAVVSNISFIFERDLTIKLNLVINNSIVFTSAITDPYPTVAFPTQTLLDANTLALNTGVGSANYDVGIVLNNGWNGGLAYNPGLCDANVKGGAAAGLTGFTTGANIENIAAHEIAHLFNAGHTMSAGTGSGCTGNLSSTSAYEIGGGSTIMAYAGAVCTGLAYQNNSDAYFHYNSIHTIATYVQTKPTCGTTPVHINSQPTVTVASNSYIIPHSTPFELTADGATSDDPYLTYSFEQYDLATAAMTMLPSSTTATGPMFRCYPPTKSNVRTFPSLDNILNNTTSPWEVLPSVSRSMNFKVVVRDEAAGGGALAQESITVNVNSTAGPFAITSNNTSNTYSFGGSPISLTWNVAGTNTGAVNAANVDILFSTDNGQTFPYTLLANTPNDGSQSIPVPNLNTHNGRFKIKGSGNIFFDINNAPQIINSGCLANGSSFSSDTMVQGYPGMTVLDLNLSSNYGSPLGAISGTINTSKPQTSLSVIDVTPGNCITFGANAFYYDAYSFQVNIAGSYSFALPATAPFGVVMNLYQNAFDPANTCSNFITSNALFNGTSAAIGTTVLSSLTPGTEYILVVGSFNSSTPAMPFSYSVNITPPSGGVLYTGTPNPGAAFTYNFIIVDNANGNIVEFSPDGDMSNASVYTGSVYKVYGLSHDTSTTLATLNTNYGGTSFSAFVNLLLNNTVCGNLSSNSKTVTIIPLTDLESILLAAERDGNKIKLGWDVKGEKNIEKYMVERSPAGEGFDEIGFVKANQQNHYNFMDEQPLVGKNYYRIFIKDYQGKKQYSNIVFVQFANKDDFISIYPNPAKENISLEANQNYECVLLDINGRLLKEFVLYPGKKYNLQVENLSSGVYILKGFSEANSFSEKIMVE